MLALFLAAALDASAFSYDAAAPLHVTYSSSVRVDGVAERAIRFDSAGGRSVSGVIVHGAGTGKHPAVLFVHWLGDDAATTNHTEFAHDAAALAKRGVTSLLIDAMWAEKDWYDKRTAAGDYQRSIDQVVDLRRSLDALLQEPNVDSSRLVYVGHDFGAMYGAVLSGVDERPQWYVLMAGTTSFSNWYLLGDKPTDVPAYVAQMAPLDPGPFLARSRAKGFLMQFSSKDFYIAPVEERAFAANVPKGRRTVTFYDVDHSMRTPKAVQDRLAWLAQKLGL